MPQLPPPSDHVESSVALYCIERGEFDRSNNARHISRLHIMDTYRLIRRLCELVLLMTYPWQSALADPMRVVVAGLERTAYTHSYALLIGEASYQIPEWPVVSDIPEHLAKVRDALIGQGFAPDHILVRQDLDGKQLRSNINQFIDTHNSPDDRILLFYNGHGASEGLYTDKERGFIVPINAPPQTDARFASMALPMDELRTKLATSGARHTLMIFDSCFSGTIFTTLGNVEQTAVISTMAWDHVIRPRVQIITAGDSDEQVPQDDEFVDFLVAGIRGKARFLDSPVVTVNDLAEYLRHAVQQTTVRSGSTGRQTSGDFMFAVQPQSKAGTAKAKPSSVLTVRYYKKPADGLTVIRALDASGVQYQALPPQIGGETLMFETNSLACNSHSDFAAIKALALALIENKVRLRMIYSFGRGDRNRSGVDLVSYRVDETVALHSPILTREDVAGLNACPAFFWKGQKIANQPPVLEGKYSHGRSS